MTKYLIGIALALLAALIAALWALDHTRTSLKEQTRLTGTLQSEIASRKKTQALLAELDTQHTQEREHANQVNAGLRADLAAGKRRLSVLATSCSTGPAATAGLGHAEARADIDPAAAERIVAIATDGDDAIRALSAAQDYITRVCLRK